jgi:hypothetical protein
VEDREGKGERSRVEERVGKKGRKRREKMEWKYCEVKQRLG